MCSPHPHASVALTEMNIGNVLSDQGDNENALVHLKKELATQEVALGPSHGSVALTEMNIGNVLSAKLEGDYENALLHLKKGLAIQLEKWPLALLM